MSSIISPYSYSNSLPLPKQNEELEKFRTTIKSPISSDSLKKQNDALEALKKKINATPKQVDYSCAIITAIAILPISFLGGYLYLNSR